MNTEQHRLQESLYEFPYHYTPHFDENGVGLHYRYLSWGLEYLCYLKHIQLIAEALRPSSVLDVGCGDGRFTGFVKGSGVRCVGADLSERAIAFARGFHPDVEFHAIDAREIEETFDLVTGIEVLEHIPDNQTSGFIQTLAERTNPGGHIILSVPTIVVPLNKKHFRHYDIEIFKAQIDAAGVSFEIRQVDYVYHSTRTIEWIQRLLNNRHWFLDLAFLRPIIWNYIWNNLRETDAEYGRHMVVVLQKAQ